MLYIMIRNLESFPKIYLFILFLGVLNMKIKLIVTKLEIVEKIDISRDSFSRSVFFSVIRDF